MSCRTVTVLSPETSPDAGRLGSGGTDPSVFTNGEREAVEDEPTAKPLFRIDDRTFHVLLIVFIVLGTTNLLGRRA